MVFDEAQQLGYQFRVLDIGGGFHGKYTSDIPFNKFASAIRDSLEKYFPNWPNLKIIGEPGQFVVRSAFTHVTDVIGKRVLSTEGEYI